MANTDLKITFPKLISCNWFFWLVWVLSLSISSFLFSQKNYAFTFEAFLFFSLEAFFFTWLLNFMQQKKASFWFKATISLLAFLFLFHLINLLLLVLLDTDFHFLYTMLFQDQASNFLVKMRAISVSLFYFILIGAAVLFFPLANLLFYQFSNLISLKRNFAISHKKLAAIGFFTLTLLASFNYAAFTLNPNRITKKMLLSSFFQPSLKTIPLKYLQQKPTKLTKLPEIGPLKFKTSKIKKPPIFLFVIESLRSDAISAKNTPALNAFQKENLGFKNAYSNANCTQQAWFSIFFSKLPWHWTAKAQGSPALQELHKLGYKIEIISSAELDYFNMKKKLFGENLELADSLQEMQAPESFQKDRLAFQALLQKRISEATLYVVFLDTPHNEYNYPARHADPLKNSSLNYFSLALFPTSEALLLKNRYLNCVSYLDSLFKSFFQFLKKNQHYQNAIIAITGDHGEEFYEEGSFFHGSHLSDAQLKIPMILKLPGISSKNIERYTSQIDIFPTILYILTGKVSSQLDGIPIFFKSKKLVSFCQNGGLDPVECVIRSPKRRDRYLVQDLKKSITPP